MLISLGVQVFFTTKENVASYRAYSHDAKGQKQRNQLLLSLVSENTKKGKNIFSILGVKENIPQDIGIWTKIKSFFGF